MTDETVDCFNCGRANPEWAQVCRSCGVALRHGQERIVAAGRVPTDQDSIISIVAVIGTIALAVLLGLFVSNLNPTEPTVGGDTSPSPTASEPPAEEPSVAASASASVAPSVSASPALPGSLVFGTSLDANRQVVDPTETFTPGMTFAHSIAHNAPFGTASLGEQVLRINEDGTDGDTLVDATQNQLAVDPAASSAGFVAGDAATFIRSWGPGLYEMRVFIGDVLIARGQFRLAEG